MLKEVNVKFLTGIFTIDVLKYEIRTVMHLKQEIFRERGIALHLQTLFHNQTELNDDKQELTSIEPMLTKTSITVSLIAKQPKQITLQLKITFIKFPPFDVEVLETDTIKRLKELVHERLPGYSIKILSVNCIGGKDLPDNYPIWACNFPRNFRCKEVEIDRKVLVLVKDGDVIRRQDQYVYYHIQTLKDIQLVLQRQYGHRGVVRMSPKDTFSLDTDTEMIRDEEFLFEVIEKAAKPHCIML